MNKNIIKISEEFTITPGARYRSDGKFSGEEFYETILKPKFDTAWNKKSETLTLDLDDTYGYASSFISEVFLRLANDYQNKEMILEKIDFISNDDPLLIESIIDVLNEHCKK